MIAVATSACPLAALLNERSGEEPICPFEALVGKWPVKVTALLERTAVVERVRGVLIVVKLESLTVAPSELRWKPDTGSRKSENGQSSAHKVFTNRATAPRSEKRRQEMRDASDQRALKNREEIERPARIGRKRAAALRDQGMRHCAQCGEDKAASEFWQNGYCRACGRAKDREMHKNRLAFKACPTCRQIRERHEFPPGSGRHSCNHCLANPPEKPKWKPSLLGKLRARRARVAAKLAELDQQLAEVASV